MPFKFRGRSRRVNNQNIPKKPYPEHPIGSKEWADKKKYDKILEEEAKLKAEAVKNYTYGGRSLYVRSSGDARKLDGNRTQRDRRRDYRREGQRPAVRSGDTRRSETTPFGPKRSDRNSTQRDRRRDYRREDNQRGGRGQQRGDVRSGDVRSGDVRSGDVRSGDVRSGDVRSGDVRTGDTRRWDGNRTEGHSKPRYSS